jgi:hypothetical protein
LKSLNRGEVILVSQNPPISNSNPFTESTAGKYFVGREEQIDQFRVQLRGLQEGNPGHAYIAGLHGTGKTSFIEKMVQIAKSEGLLGVSPTLDPDRPARDHISTILKSVVKGLHNYVKEQSGGKGSNLLGDWDKGQQSSIFFHPRIDKLESDALNQDFETLQRLMKEAGRLGCVICIDEGQRIDPIALSALKNALQSINCFLVVLSLRLVEASGGSVAAGRTLLEEKAHKAEGDFGASRFFITGLSMGPFSNDQEARDCIRERLKNNAIQFDTETIDRIGKITGRVPREMISLACQVYNRAVKDGVRTANVLLLNETYRDMYSSHIGEAMALCETISEHAKTTLKGLTSLQSAVTPLALARHLYSNASADLYMHLGRSIVGDLDRICAVSTFIQKVDDAYQIADPIRAYALALALGMY